MAKVAHSKVLAVDPAIFGSLMVLPSSLAATETRTTTGRSGKAQRGAVAVVSINGPLAQRAYLDMEVCGIIDGYDSITERFAAALADPDVAALVLRINSPGGDVAGLEEAIRRMRAMADDAGKPVVAFADELAASAAYWIASGVADEVILPPMGRVGSIGVLGAYVDSTAALEKAGHKVTIVRDPAGKAAAHPAGPVAEVADAELAEAVTDSTKRFMGAVSDRRGVEVAELRELNGAVVRGKAAVKAGLADRVGSLEDAIARAHSLARTGNHRPRERGAAVLATMTKSELVAWGLHTGRVSQAQVNASAHEPRSYWVAYLEGRGPSLSFMSTGRQEPPAPASPLSDAELARCELRGVSAARYARMKARTVDAAKAKALIAWADREDGLGRRVGVHNPRTAEPVTATITAADIAEARRANRTIEQVTTARITRERIAERYRARKT